MTTASSPTCSHPGCGILIVPTSTGWAHVDTHGIDPGHAAIPGRLTFEPDSHAALRAIQSDARRVLAVGDRAVRIGTHYDDCWVNHRDCLAQRIIALTEEALA